MAVALLLITGCASGGLDYQGLEAQMGADNCAGALKHIETTKSSYGKNQELIYLMDSGMVNLLCKDNKESNNFLQAGDILAQELWTKSISREAASFVVNDYTKPYSGEDFEIVMINMLGALNYSIMGDFEGALVESRRINSKLTEFNDKYKEKSVYSEDAFARYLSAMLYEADAPTSLQNLDSAYIDYYKAYKTFVAYAEKYKTPLPRVFVEDFLRVAEATDRLSEIPELAQKGAWLKHSEATKMGRIVLIYFTGKSPVKIENSFVAYAPGGPIKLAFPKFSVTSPACSSAELRVNSKGTGTTLTAKSELVENINAIAVQSLNDRKGRIIAKSIARAIIKQATVNAAANTIEDENARMVAKFLGRVIAAVTEIADTRSWRTLPGEIHVVRTFVPPGEFAVSSRMCGKTADLGTLKLNAGETKFLLVETMY